MLRNTRKRLHRFFRPRMPSCSSIFRPTTRSQRARSAPPGYRTFERPLRDAFHRPGQGHTKRARSQRRRSAARPHLHEIPCVFHARQYFVRPMRINSRMPRSDPPVPRPRISTPSRTSPNMSGSAQAPAPSCSRFSTIAEATKAARSTFGWPFLAVPAQQSFHQVRRGLGAEVFTGKRSHRRA